MLQYLILVDLDIIFEDFNIDCCLYKTKINDEIY